MHLASGIMTNNDMNSTMAAFTGSMVYLDLRPRV